MIIITFTLCPFVPSARPRARPACPPRARPACPPRDTHPPTPEGTPDHYDAYLGTAIHVSDNTKVVFKSDFFVKLPARGNTSPAAIFYI